MDGTRFGRRTFLAAGATMASRRVWAAALPVPPLTGAAMRADLLLLERLYAGLHPGLYRYATPAQTTARFAAARAAITAPLPLDAFYLRLARLLAEVRCGHSYANFYNQRHAVQAALFDRPTGLPLAFLWLGSRLIVTADPFGTGIAPGSEVLAIDGRPAGEVLAALMPFARADGHNDAKRRRLLSVQGEDRYETFDIFFALRFGARDRYTLTIADPVGRRRIATVAAVSPAQRQARRATPDAGGDGPLWTIEHRGGAALLTMDNWGFYDSEWDWRGWLDAAVDRLVADRVPALIVDIRRNEGGEDCGDALIARLIDRPVQRETVRRLVRYERLPAEFRPYCDTWDRAFDTLGVGARRVDERFLQLTDPDRGDQTIVPHGARFTGRVIVLTGPQNSSATFQFAGAMQRLRLATLVGEETGGNRRGINGGCFYFLRLPETGLQADLPLIGNFPPTPQPDAGVRPDVVAPLTARAVAAGTDPAMARALALAA